MLYILGIFLLIGFTCYACCCVAHDSDEQSERMFNEWREKADIEDK